MDLTPYLDALRRDLASAAAPGGPEVLRAADLLIGSLDAATRLCLLELLADAAAEITTRLNSATIDVRLRGRDADLVVTELTATEPSATPPAAGLDGADLARITLRLPEPLKEQVERAAGGEGASVNAWLVRAVATAVAHGPGQPRASSDHKRGQRITGFAQA